MLERAKQADAERAASSCGSYALRQGPFQNLKCCESAVVHILLGQQEVGTQKPVSFAFTLKPSLSGCESKCSPPAGASMALRHMPSPLYCRWSDSFFYLFSTVAEWSEKVTHLAKVRQSQGSRTNNCNTSCFNLDGLGHHTRCAGPHQAKPVPLLSQVLFLKKKLLWFLKFPLWLFSRLLNKGPLWLDAAKLGTPNWCSLPSNINFRRLWARQAC